MRTPIINTLITIVLFGAAASVQAANSNEGVGKTFEVNAALSKQANKCDQTAYKAAPICVAEKKENKKRFKALAKFLRGGMMSSYKRPVTRMPRPVVHAQRRNVAI